MHGTFTAERWVYCDGANATGKKTVTVMTFLFRRLLRLIYVLRGSLFQILSRSPVKVFAQFLAKHLYSAACYVAICHRSNL